MKTCKGCQIEKPISEFHAHPGGKYGVKSKCKPCVAEISRSTYDRQKLREYEERNRERIREWRKVAHQRRYANPDYRARTADYGREYRQTHLAEKAERERRRKNILRACPVRDFTRSQWEILKNAFGHRCAYCGVSDVKLTRDHVIPIAHGGWHTAKNIVPACISCNARKGSGPIPPPMVVIPTH